MSKPLQPAGPVDEQALVTRARSGDREAFGAIVNRHQDAVYRIVRGILGDPSESEDVAQDVFLKAYQAIPKFRGESGLFTWIYRIAVNEALKARKRRPRTTEAVPESAAPDPVTPYEGPTIAHLEQLLEDLPEEFRTAIVLRDLQGLSYQEISEALDIPMGTVESRIFRARREMRERWRKLKEEHHVV